MSFSVISGVLASSVAATSGTLTVSYPAGKSRASFYLAMGHKLTVGGNALSFPKDFDVTLNDAATGTITVTNKTSSAWAQGAEFRLQMEEKGERAYVSKANKKLMPSAAQVTPMLISLGNPVAADADGIVVSSSLNTGVAATLAASTLDVPRNVVAAWTNTAVITVKGTDVYGAAMTESSASGTSFTGKKAFKTITSVTVSANVTGLTVGWGDVLGLPVFLPSVAHIVNEIQDSAIATAGTTVAGIRTAAGSTATTGDVRGTYDPNAACDGGKVFELLVMLPDPSDVGIAQYSA